MGINQCLCVPKPKQFFYDLRHLFFPHLEDSPVGTLHRVPGFFICLHPLWHSHKTLFNYFWNATVASSIRVPCWFGQRFTLPPPVLLCYWSTKDLEEKKLSSPPLVAGHWTWNIFSFWHKVTHSVFAVEPDEASMILHLPSSVTKPVCTNMVCTVPVFPDYKLRGNILSMGGIGFPYHSSFPGTTKKPDRWLANRWVCCVLKPCVFAITVYL